MKGNPLSIWGGKEEKYRHSVNMLNILKIASLMFNNSK